jgi:hypothetical protein
MRPVLLEAVCQNFVVVHLSHSAVAVRHVIENENHPV